MLDEDLWFAPVVRQEHADARIVERLRLAPHELDRVVGIIRLCLLYGRFSSARPPWLDYGRARPDRFPTLYVWDETLSHCWILRRTERALYLVTVLLERTIWGARLEDGRNLRTGSSRA